jgi:hypothetical protein
MTSTFVRSLLVAGAVAGALSLADCGQKPAADASNTASDAMAAANTATNAAADVSNAASNVASDASNMAASNTGQ